MPVRSLPIAETARCCFIFGGSSRGSMEVGGQCTTGRRGGYARVRAAHCGARRRGFFGNMRDPLFDPAQVSVKTMFAGNLVAIVTPMRRDGAVDFDAWTRLIDFHLQNGTHGIVVGGSTGESPTITEHVLRELTERACAQVAKRIPVIVGAGTSNTAATVVRTRWLSGLPVDGLLVVTPAYNKPPQEGLFRHFAAVAEASRVPVVLYNIPGRTAVD